MLYIDPIQLMLTIIVFAGILGILFFSLVFFVTRALRSFIRRFPHLIKE
jgi:hypothetical protein